MAGQVALSLVALVGAGLFVKSLANAQRIDPGFDHEKLAVLTVDLGAQGYDEARARDFQRRVLERAAALPGVERATLASGIPLFQGGFMRTVFPEGVDSSDRKNGKLVQLNTVEPGYFATMGVTLLRGRDFAPSDHPDVAASRGRERDDGEAVLARAGGDRQALQVLRPGLVERGRGHREGRQVQLPRREPPAAHLPLARPRRSSRR